MALGKQKYNPLSGKFDVRVSQINIKNVNSWRTITTDDLELQPGNYLLSESIDENLNIDFVIPNSWDYSIGKPYWRFSDQHKIADEHPISFGKDTDLFLNGKGGIYEEGKFLLDVGGDVSFFVLEEEGKYSYHTGL